MVALAKTFCETVSTCTRMLTEKHIRSIIVIDEEFGNIDHG